MKKEYLLKGLDCANCSAIIQREVAQLEGVRDCAVNLMKQTLSLEVDAAHAAGLTERIAAIVHGHEPDVQVREAAPRGHGAHGEEAEEDDSRRRLLRLAFGALIFVLGVLTGGVIPAPAPLRLAVLLAAYVVLGYDVLLRAGKNIVRGHVFDENFLMGLSTVGAFLIGEYPEAVAVMLFYQLGELFQDMAVHRSRRSITELMDLRPEAATVSRNGELSVLPPEEVAVGETILVRPGEKIPLDGVVLSGSSLLDTRALTGESVPRSARPGDEVLSGCINQSGVLTLRVTREFGESAVSRIIDLVEHASARKAATENFITAFARWYTPAVVILAALLALLPPLLFHGVWADWIHRGLVFLVISCPCALVISIPLAFFGGIGAASRHGVLVKGGNFLEALNRVDTVVFDKTGTLTKGVFRVTGLYPAEGFREEALLACAALAERFSNHPIARSVLEAYNGQLPDESVTEYTELPGRGVCVSAAGRRVLAGNAKLMEEENIPYIPCGEAGTRVYVALDAAYVGCILISDQVKADSASAIAALKAAGVEQTVMLTGDEEEIARVVAEQLGLDAWYARLLPQEKVEWLEVLDSRKKPGAKLAFVGDGINDAPVLARADVGIAMGALGSDAAIEAADVVLMTDEPSALAEAIAVAKATRRIVVQNIVIALSIKGILLLLGAFGLAGMWEAVFGDVGVAVIAVLNSMRLLKK